MCAERRGEQLVDPAADALDLDVVDQADDQHGERQAHRDGQVGGGHDAHVVDAEQLADPRQQIDRQQVHRVHQEDPDEHRQRERRDELAALRVVHDALGLALDHLDEDLDRGLEAAGDAGRRLARRAPQQPAASTPSEDGEEDRVEVEDREVDERSSASGSAGAAGGGRCIHRRWARDLRQPCVVSPVVLYAAAATAAPPSTPSCTPPGPPAMPASSVAARASAPAASMATEPPIFTDLPHHEAHGADARRHAREPAASCRAPSRRPAPPPRRRRTAPTAITFTRPVTAHATRATTNPTAACAATTHHGDTGGLLGPQGLRLSRVRGSGNRFAASSSAAWSSSRQAGRSHFSFCQPFLHRRPQIRRTFGWGYGTFRKTVKLYVITRGRPPAPATHGSVR